MSHMRHARLDPRSREGAAVTTLIWDYPPGHHIPEHSHDADQLVYAASGVMTVTTAAGTWVIPPQRGVWIPTGVPHSVLASGRVAMRTLYFRTGLVRSLPECVVLEVPPLLRELVLHICGLGELRAGDRGHRHLLGVLLDLLHSLPVIPLRLPLPSDARALAVAQALLDAPGGRRPLAALCAEVGTSRRTVERLFLAETGMGVGRWRQQAGLLAAIRSIAAGAKVAAAAREAGCRSPSAFIAMFRSALGTTPARYFRAEAGSGTGDDAPRLRPTLRRARPGA